MSQHPSIPEKVYYLLVWLTNPEAKSSLILYGPPASGKSVAIKEAINQLEDMRLNDRHLPKEVSILERGLSETVYWAQNTHHMSEYIIHSENLLENRTIIVVTAEYIPEEMAELLVADSMKFEYEE